MEPKGVIEFETVTPGVADLYRITDLVGPTCSTFNGCENDCKEQERPDCCRERSFSQLEFDHIAAGKSAAYMYQAANRYSGKRVGYCPFLGDDGQCEVYEVRPLECRTIATVDPQPSTCRKGKEPVRMTEAALVMRVAIHRLMAVIAGAGPRRPLSEWLFEFQGQRDIQALIRRTPGR